MCTIAATSVAFKYLAYSWRYTTSVGIAYFEPWGESHGRAMVLDRVSYSAYTVLYGHIITYDNALSVVSLF